jgi:hypothetical protein
LRGHFQQKNGDSQPVNGSRMDDQRTDRESGTIKSRARIAAGEIVRATIIVASACAILGALFAIPEIKPLKTSYVPSLYERIFVGFFGCGMIGAAFGAAAGIFLALFHFVKSFYFPPLNRPVPKIGTFWNKKSSSLPVQKSNLAPCPPPAAPS